MNVSELPPERRHLSPAGSERPEVPNLAPCVSLVCVSLEQTALRDLVLATGSELFRDHHLVRLECG